MKMKDFKSEIHKELMHSDTLYCVYCIEPKGDKIVCCEEYHFVNFSNLYPQDQDILIQEQLEEYEKWSKNQ